MTRMAFQVYSNDFRTGMVRRYCMEHQFNMKTAFQTSWCIRRMASHLRAQRLAGSLVGPLVFVDNFHAAPTQRSAGGLAGAVAEVRSSPSSAGAR